MKNKIIKSKKGVELSLNTVIIALILLITIVVVIALFMKLFTKEGGVISGHIDSAADPDGDGVINMFDKCPCDKFTAGQEDPTNTGCPTGKEPPSPKPPTC